MNRQENAKDLFERSSVVPRSSESFWTSLFALFLLDLGRRDGALRIWQRRDTAKAPWYEARKGSPQLNLAGLDFECISVEPKAAQVGRHFNDVARISVTIAGFEPDILLRLPSHRGHNHSKWVLIENKTIEKLQQNQLENYPRLARAFKQREIESEVLLLMSVGSEGMDRQIRKLREGIGTSFGLLLWEDVLRQMKELRFELPAVDVDALQRYTFAMDTDAQWT